MSNVDIDLVIPGLLNLPVYELDTERLIQHTPYVHKLLRFADQESNTQATIDDILIYRLGLEQAALPYARACKPDQTDTSSVLIKPVHLKADINNAVVFPLNNSDDLNLIIKELSEFFKEDCNIEVLPDQGWLMHLKNASPVCDVPHYLSALGKKVTHYLEQAKTSMPWFKLFNEMQMFLYQHEINQNRQQSGLPMINSLWCWGADTYRGERLEDTQWFSDDFLMQKLGHLYTGDSQTLSELSAELKSDSVIVELSLLKALKGDSTQNLEQILIEIEKNCLEPVMNSKARQVLLHTGGSMNFRYKPSTNWKLWKRAVKLPELIV